MQVNRESCFHSMFSYSKEIWWIKNGFPFFDFATKQTITTNHSLSSKLKDKNFAYKYNVKFSPNFFIPSYNFFHLFNAATIFLYPNSLFLLFLFQLFLIHLASALGSQIKIQRAKLRRNENMLLASYEGSSGSISYVSWPCASDDSNHANSQNIDSFNYLNKSSCITHIDAHTHIFTYTHYASISINLYICLIILKCYQHTSIWVAVYEMDIDCPDVMAGSTHHSMVGHYFFFIFFFLQLPMNLVSGY